MVRSQKYWISPDGELVVVDRCHVVSVIDQPARFNLTREAVEAEYRRFGEPLGLEGKAREAILVKLFGMGWVRVRHHPVSDVWVFQLDPSRWGAAQAAIGAFLAAVDAGVAGRWADAAVLLTGPDGATRGYASAPAADGGTLSEKWDRLAAQVHREAATPPGPSPTKALPV
jgi:hypothetical protein